MHDNEDISSIKTVWIQLTTMYKKRLVELMPVEEDTKAALDFQQKAVVFITKELRDPRHDYEIGKLKEKLCNVKSDIPELLNFCVMFYT